MSKFIEMSREKFDKQFKLGAVTLIVREGYSVKKVNQELEVHENSLCHWVQEYETYRKNVFLGKGIALAGYLAQDTTT